MNNAPRRKPTAAGTQLNSGEYIFSDISMAGLRSDQKLAATITPPVKPSMGSSTPRFMVLKKKTSDAPIAVSNQVNVVAINAEYTGPISTKNFSIDSIVYGFTNMLSASCALMVNGAWRPVLISIELSNANFFLTSTLVP